MKHNVTKLIVSATVVVFISLLAVPLIAAETTFTGSYRIRSVMDYNWDQIVMRVGWIFPTR